MERFASINQRACAGGRTRRQRSRSLVITAFGTRASPALLVVEDAEASGLFVRGIFSRARLERQLGGAAQPVS